MLLSTVILDMASVHLDGLPNLAYSTIHHKFDELKVTEVICIKVLKYLADCPKGPIKKDRSNQMTTQRSTLLPGCTAGHSRRQHWSVIFGFNHSPFPDLWLQSASLNYVGHVW